MCARGAPYDDSDRELAFYTPSVGLLDADWLQRVSCGALIGWSLQRVTSLRHALAAKMLLLKNAICGLLHSTQAMRTLTTLETNVRLDTGL